jgi:hypothetical protein
VGLGNVTNDAQVKATDLISLIKTSTELVGNTTLQDDDKLTFAIGASEIWQAEMALFVYGAAGGDIQVAITVPSGATMAFGIEGLPTTASSLPSAEQEIAILTASGTPASLATFAGVSMVRLTGSVINSTTPGNVRLQWAQSTSSGTNTEVRVGSRLTARKAT